MAAACGSDKPNPFAPPGHQGLQIVAGNNAADTVLASPAQALIIELRNEARQPLKGVVVRFESLFGSGSSTPWALISRVDGSTFTTLTTDTTNADGRASALVQFGSRAGTARVVVRIPELGLRDTATFVIQPGNVTTVIVEPQLVTRYAGVGVPLSASVRDSYGNLRSDPVTYAAVYGGVTVSNGVATPQTEGLHKIVASAGAANDTARISSPPRGVLAVARFGTLFTINTDGSGAQEIASVDHVSTMVWSPDGASLLVDGHMAPLRRVTLSGQVTTLTEEPAYYPHFSADGTKVYYASFGTGSTWRIRSINADGTDAADVVVHATEHFVAPAPAPSASYLVMVGVRGSWQDVLWRFDVGSGVAAPLGIGGHTPRWSPDGASVAFVEAPAQRIAVMDAALGNVRRVTQETAGYGLGISWSPDGKWLAVSNESTWRIELVHVASGVVLPLDLPPGMYAPAWRP